MRSWIFYSVRSLEQQSADIGTCRHVALLRAHYPDSEQIGKYQFYSVWFDLNRA